MFALVIPPYPVNIAVQTISPTKYCFQIENAKHSNEFTLFLTDILNFAQGYNAAIYLAYTPFTDWKYLGFINANKPSIICKIPTQTLDTINNMNNIGFMNNININKDILQIGISIETDLEIQSKPQPIIDNSNNTTTLMSTTTPTSSSPTSSSSSTLLLPNSNNNNDNILKSEEFKKFAFKLCDNLVNYILSFSTSNNTVPISSVNKWYENFQKKLKNDSLDFLK